MAAVCTRLVIWFHVIYIINILILNINILILNINILILNLL